MAAHGVNSGARGRRVIRIDFNCSAASFSTDKILRQCRRFICSPPKPENEFEQLAIFIKGRGSWALRQCPDELRKADVLPGQYLRAKASGRNIDDR